MAQDNLFSFQPNSMNDAQQGLLSAFNPSDAYSQNLRQPVQGDMTLGNLASYFMPISRNVMPYEDSPRLGAGDYNLDFPQVMKDAYSGINKFGQAFRGELNPQELQQLASNTALNVAGGSLLGSRVIPNAVPSGGILGMGVSKGSKQVKNPLIVQHNINETALMESDRLGGLPVPSLAVSKVDNPLLGFGDVTLVGNPNMAKPSGSNPVYRADAYTTRRPKPDIFVNKEAEDFAETLTTPFKDLPKGSSVSQLDGYSVNQSIAEDLYRGFEGSSSNIPLRAKYMIDKGLLDPKQFETQYDITKFVRENFAETEDYTNYITKLKKDMIASGGNAKERLFVEYTDNGRKYLPATLENYVKMMKKKRGAGEETTFPSMGALRAKLTPKFKNITEVKSERNRVVDREKFEEVKNQVNLDYEDLLSDLSKKLPEKTDWRTSEELFEDLILGRLGSHPYSKPFEPYIDDAIKKSASELREKLKSIPTEYFEVKPQRGVKIEEFEGAIIPDNSLKSTEEILKRRGINKIFKYGSEDQRKELMKKFPELMFSVGGLGLLGIGSVEEEPVSLL